MYHWLTQYQPGHDLRRDGRQQDSVAVMAARDEVSVDTSLAQNWQFVGRSGAQTRPVFVAFGGREPRHNLDRSIEEALDCVCISSLVVAGVFESRPNHQPAVA